MATARVIACYSGMGRFNIVRYCCLPPVLMLVSVGLGFSLLSEIATAQSSESESLSFLHGRASVSLPRGDRIDMENDSLLHDIQITKGRRKYFFRSFQLAELESAEQFLEQIANMRLKTVPADVTVNLDSIECGEFAGVDLSFWIWHATAKPQGLLLSKDRILILEDRLISLSVEGDGRGLIEGDADEYLGSVTYLDKPVCMN